LADVEHFAAFCNVRQQDIYEGMLPVESRTARIFERCDALDRQQVSIAESVILGSEQTFPALKGPPGINPIIHDAPAYKRCHLFRAVPAVKQQSIAAVGAVTFLARSSVVALWLPLLVATSYRFSLKSSEAGLEGRS
jgi:hypothetical protein